MAITEKKLSNCRKCKSEFEPLYRKGIIVSRLCLSCLTSKAKEKVRKDKAAQKKALKEKLKTKSQWLNDLQKVFNEFTRLRDKLKPCISCGKALTGKYDAGHFMSIGAYPNLRFNEDNVHGQCVECNQHKHGNITEYSIRLKDRIGLERCDKLLEERNKPLLLTIPEIKELLIHYKQKVKHLKNN